MLSNDTSNTCRIVAILIDISGSMFAGANYDLAVQTTNAMVESFTSSDMFMIVAYTDNEVLRIYPHKTLFAPATKAHRQRCAYVYE